MKCYIHPQINLKCLETLLTMKLVLHQIKYKLGYKNLRTKQSAKIFNNYFINSIDELITQKPKTELSIFSLWESYPHKFPQIINIPINETQVIRTATSLKKIKLHVVMMVYQIRY